MPCTVTVTVTLIIIFIFWLCWVFVAAWRSHRGGPRERARYIRHFSDCPTHSSPRAGQGVLPPPPTPESTTEPALADTCSVLNRHLHWDPQVPRTRACGQLGLEAQRRLGKNAHSRSCESGQHIGHRQAQGSQMEPSAPHRKQLPKPGPSMASHHCLQDRTLLYCHCLVTCF